MVYSRGAAPSLRSPSRATGSELKNAEWCRSKKSASPSSTRMPGPPSIVSSSTAPSSFQRSSYAMPICVPWARSRLSTRTISILGASSPRQRSVRMATTARLVARGRPGGAGGDQAGLVGEDDELRPVTGAELDHRPADVGLGGGGAEHQDFGDFVVGQTVRDQGHDLAFPVGEHL